MAPHLPAIAAACDVQTGRFIAIDSNQFDAAAIAMSSSVRVDRRRITRNARTSAASAGGLGWPAFLARSDQGSEPDRPLDPRSLNYLSYGAVGREGIADRRYDGRHPDLGDGGDHCPAVGAVRCHHLDSARHRYYVGDA